MLNITRIHNGLSSVAGMRRVIALANDYKERRVTFGKLLKEHDLHMHVLGDMEKCFRGNLVLMLEATTLL